MKRLTAMILCLIMVFSLCACGVKPGGTTNEPVFTEPPVVTLADGSVVDPALLDDQSPKQLEQWRQWSYYKLKYQEFKK